MYDAFRGGFGCLLLVGLVILVFFPLWRICTKAGYPGVMSLLFYIPVVNFVMVWVMALSEWPIERALREAQSRPGAPIG